MASDGFLTSFKQNTGNFSRAYLFYVKLLFEGVNIPNSQKFLVRSSSIPTSVIEQIEVPFQGMLYKMASTPTFEEWTCTFNSDNNFDLRAALRQWQLLVHDPKTNFHGKPEEYFGEIEIEMLDPFQSYEAAESVTTKYKSTLYNAWPSSLGAIELAYDSKEVTQFDCSFTYNWHEEGITA